MPRWRCITVAPYSCPILKPVASIACPKLLEWLAAQSSTTQPETNSTSTTASNMTQSPVMTDTLLATLKAHLPKYQGMPHPQPSSGNPQCDDVPWSAPFLPDYEGPLHAKHTAGNLPLTMCNYYLPAAPDVRGIHRFLWQVQYLVSQGFYVLLDFNSNRWWEPNVQNSQLLAHNWGNLWRALSDLPQYKQHMSGRVFPDFLNEPSRWNCQRDTACYRKDWIKQGNITNMVYKPVCAPIMQSYGMTAAVIWKLDPKVPIVVNGLGQSRNYHSDLCGGDFQSMSWGDGFITNNTIQQSQNISDPSGLFNATTQMAGPGLVLAPHLYPPSITTNPPETLTTNTRRWNMSWGLKMQGLDVASSGERLPQMPVIVGEFGAYDFGDNSWNNTDSTQYSSYDKMWMKRTATYLKDLAASVGDKMSWFFWAWCANSRTCPWTNSLGFLLNRLY